MKLSHETSENQTIKERVLRQLKKNPLLTAKPLCKLLDLNYDNYGDYVANIRSQWKISLRFGQGSKVQMPASFHKARGWVYVDRLDLDRGVARERGWILSGSKNRALIWKDPLGRMEWFETGRVNLIIYPPALKGNVYQLFCNGFSMTELIPSPTLLGVLLKKIRLKAAHAVFETSQKLPYMVIDLFKLSSGIVIRSGDSSHRTAIEVEFCYPDFAEQNERLLRQILKILQPVESEVSPQKPKSFYVS